MKKRQFKRNNKRATKDQMIDLSLYAFSQIPDDLPPCILCDEEKVVTLANFITNDDKTIHAFGGIPGRIRIFTYTLCKSCFNRSDKDQAVEEAIKASVTSHVEAVKDELDHALCIGCDGTPDMIHTYQHNGIYGTCQNCRDNLENLCEIAKEKMERLR